MDGSLAFYFTIFPAAGAAFAYFARPWVGMLAEWMASASAEDDGLVRRWLQQRSLALAQQDVEWWLAHGTGLGLMAAVAWAISGAAA
jgi:hypothetical protein